jgi:DNA mismatch endonuclease (patch repair protein)
LKDPFTPEERSAVMRAVRGKDTGPEMIVRRLVHSLGLRYRLHAKDLPGKPDLVFRGRRKAIFVHGCFWHGHQCKRGNRTPVANREYWEKKIARNQERDKANQSRLAALGWQVRVIWTCQLVNSRQVEKKLKRWLAD